MIAKTMNTNYLVLDILLAAAGGIATIATVQTPTRSEERRVGKECA